MEPAAPGAIVTLKDVAAASGVSVSTASRALDERSASRSAAAAHVRKVAEELGYRRNSFASSLRRGETRTLGVLVPRLRDTVLALLFEELERAAHAGRLAKVPGLGPKRIRGVREALAGRFRRAVGNPGPEPPPVEDVLAVDEQYRKKAAAGELRLIAPRRFNPGGEAWLPVMRTRYKGREDPRLGGGVLREGRRDRSVHGGDGDGRAARRQAGDPRPRGGLRPPPPLAVRRLTARRGRSQKRWHADDAD